MRVTQNMMNSRMMLNLNANNVRMDKYQEMLATGRKLNRPSDDPVGVGYTMRYEAQISRNEQYQRNVDEAVSRLEFTDSMMNQINSIMQRARELAVRASNDSLAADDRKAVAQEIDQCYKQLVSAANTQFNGQYLFNGQNTDLQPYSEGTAANDQTDTASIVFMISEGVAMPVNVTGEEIFGSPAGADPTSDNAFHILNLFKTALNANDGPGIRDALARIDSRSNKVQHVWSDVGARANRTQLMETRLKDFDVNLTELLSKTVDADIGKTIMDLKVAENVQRSSLSAGARIIQPTLVDFLK